MKLEELREIIDKTDEQLIKLFVERMAVCSEIGEFKRKNGLPVEDALREAEKVRAVRAMVPDELKDSIEELYECIFELSRRHQSVKGDGSR